MGSRFGQAELGQCGNDVGGQILMNERKRSIPKQLSDERPDYIRIVASEFRLTFQPANGRWICLVLAERRRAAGYRLCHGSSLPAGDLLG